MMHMRFIIAAVALALVALLLMLDSQRISPGELSIVHASEPELVGPESCNACHGGLLQSMTGACLACHESMEAQLEGAVGFHGQLDPDLASDCASCHSEHHGPDFSMVADRSFVQAGLGSRNEYQHEGLGYGLQGAHLGLACNTCHEHADTRVLPAGAYRFLGLDQQCMTCHEDEHEGEYGTNCSECHGQSQPFAQVGGNAHNTFAPIAGQHLEVSCEECHEPGTAVSVADVARRFVAGDVSVPARTCASCHPSQHASGFLDGVADLAGVLGDQLVCQHCHNPEHASFLGGQPRMEAALHAASGFALELPHAEVDCHGCHAGFGEHDRDFTEAFPGREADTCSSCHMDAHDGQFTDGPHAAGGCLGCHERTAFAPTTFGVEQHAQTAFPLEGSHAAADCLSCHAPPEGSPRITDDGRVTARFVDTPVACSACHEAPHGELFLAGLLDAVGCNTCHDATHETFLGDNLPMEERTELHEASGFALTAPHHQAACADCHEGFGTRAPVASIDNRFDGFRAAFPGRDGGTCQQCHPDPHVEQFADGAFAAKECLECHDRLAFRPPVFGFEHHAQTDFPLTGGHEAVGCNACHLIPEGAKELGPDGRLTRAFAGTPSDCAACHANVHGDAFDRPGLPEQHRGATGCERCHTTETFEQPGPEDFDHVLWGGVALEGAHRSADCSGCHLADRSSDPPRLTFSEVRSTDCSGCHADRHVGQFAVAGVTECTRCHNEAASFAELAFDHQVDSRFPLDAQHGALPCSACHVPMPLTDGTEAVRYKPLGSECRDCHDPEGLQRTAGAGR